MQPNTAKLLGALTALAACNIAFGLIVQVIPLAMEHRNASASLIGWNTSAGQFGTFLGGLALPAMSRAISGATLVRVSTLILIATTCLFGLTDPIWSWYVIRFVAGLAIATLFTISETWLLTASGEKQRARIMAIYMSMLTVTFGIGPFIVAFVGFSGWAPWAFGMGFMTLAFVISLLVKVEDANKNAEHASFVKVMSRAPLIFLTFISTTLFEACYLAFFSIYALRNGLTAETAAAISGFGIAGCILFFYPTGQLADRWSRTGTLVICTLIAIICSLALLFAISSWWIWPVILLCRAGVFGAYGVALTLNGDTFKGPDLVAAASLVAILWGLGGMFGPPIAGYIIDTSGIETLPYILALCCATPLIGLSLNGWRMVRS